MQLIKNTTDFRFENTAVALGKFDGIHLGHRRILQEIVHAKEDGYTTVIFTFSMPPTSLLKGETESLLLTEEEKISLYEQQGVDILIIYPVSREFFSMEPEKFLRDILCGQLGMKLLIGGDDIHFGRNRRGDAAMALSMSEELGYKVRIIRKETVAEILKGDSSISLKAGGTDDSSISMKTGGTDDSSISLRAGGTDESSISMKTGGTDESSISLKEGDANTGSISDWCAGAERESDGEEEGGTLKSGRKDVGRTVPEDEIIGSTKIRECLQKGEIEMANRMLGYPYFFTGIITHGKAVGRTLGFPTINLKIGSGKLLPAYGVYASETVLEGKTYQSITNIGVRPTVSDTMEPSVETYLFGFQRDVYGEKATVRLLRFQRPEMKFAGVEELRAQIERDKEKRFV